MIFFKKKHKFYLNLYGWSEPLALKVFLDEKEYIEKILDGEIKATLIHHNDLGYVDYIVYTLKEKEN